MAAFGPHGGVRVVGAEEAETLGLAVSMNTEQYLDPLSHFKWTIVSISLRNNGGNFVEFLFATFLAKRKAGRQCRFRALGNLLIRTCPRRHKSPAGPKSIFFNFKFQIKVEFPSTLHAEAVRGVVECPCNFVIVNASVVSFSLPPGLQIGIT